jgi:hypothetical protein
MKRGKLVKHFIYWILPLLIVLVCILIYFYDLLGMAAFIAPDINREFGMVENLQLVLLILIFLTALKGWRIKQTKSEKYGYLFLAIAAVFVFFEEIDYGLHFYDYFTGRITVPADQGILSEQEFRNLHNQGKTTSVIKFIVYSCILLLFVCFPLIPGSRLQKVPLLEYLTPSKYIIATAITLLLLNQTALYLNTQFYNKHVALAGNISEFEEIMTYYIFFLYLLEMVNKPQVLPVKQWGLKYRFSPGDSSGSWRQQKHA